MAGKVARLGAGVVGVCTVIATLVAVADYLEQPPPPEPPPTTIAAARTSPITAALDAETLPVPEVGTCLNDGAPVPCDQGHQAQIVGGTQECGSSTLIRFAGGDPSVELLKSSIKVTKERLGNVELCLVRWPALQTATAAHMFTNGRGDFARRCFDDRIGVEVGCDIPHTREAVHTRSGGSTNELDCESRAEKYLGAGYTRYVDQLSFRQSHSDLGTTCWVVARANNLLTSSIRAVGTRALPLAPGT